MAGPLGSMRRWLQNLRKVKQPTTAPAEQPPEKKEV